MYFFLQKNNDVLHSLFDRRVTKIDKKTGLKMEFMVNYPELGRVDSLDIYADEYLDGNLSSCHNKHYFNSQKQKKHFTSP